MILRLRAVEGLTGISRATIYRMVKAGTFPAQVQISPGAVGWRCSGGPIIWIGWLAGRRLGMW